MANQDPIKEAIYDDVGDFLWKVITIPYRVTRSVWDVIWPSDNR